MTFKLSSNPDESRKKFPERKKTGSSVQHIQYNYDTSVLYCIVL